MCTEDIEEAQKCLALGRYTACVFHLMRVMERGVHTVVTQLGVTISGKDGRTRTWRSIATDLAEKVKRMPHGEERIKWASIASMLHHVNDAWRNPTNHPKSTYTETQAHEIFGAVRGFMRRLAEAC